MVFDNTHIHNLVPGSVWVAPI